MGKLFLKLFISLLIVNGISNWVYMRVWEAALGQQSAEIRKQRYGGTFFLVEHALEFHPLEQWPARFKELQHGSARQPRDTG